MRKACIACGMPMEKPEDFAMQDESRDYCVHCARPDGSMQSYEEKLDRSAARDAAKIMMAKLPAWKDKGAG